jgi:cytochrome b561
MTTDRYDRVTRSLHWVIALLLLGQFAFGYWLGDMPRNTPARGIVINLHKSSGMLLGLLILLRVFWRFTHAAPRQPSDNPTWQRALAAATHHALYLMMIVMPLSGYVASNFSKHGVKFFNSWMFPPWGPDDKVIYAFFNQTHKVCAILFLALIVLHVAGAIYHALRRDGIMARIALRPF